MSKASIAVQLPHGDEVTTEVCAMFCMLKRLILCKLSYQRLIDATIQGICCLNLMGVHKSSDLNYLFGTPQANALCMQLDLSLIPCGNR